MHEGELELTDETAGRMIARRFPALAGVPLRRVRTAGTVNTIFRIGEDLTARFPILPETESVLHSEAAAMRELAAVCPVPTPRPYGIGAATGDYPSAWSVQTWLPGETAGPQSHSATESIALDVAEVICALRTADVRGRRFDGRGRGGDLRDHDDWVALCVDRSAHLLDAARVGRLWERWRVLPTTRGHVMSHRDLTPPKLLVSGDRLTGVLDGGSFGPADPALDLVAAWHLFDAPRRRLVRDRVGADDVEWRRGAAWALQQAMGLAWYYEQSNPEMSALGLSTMRRLLDDEEFA